MTAKYKHKQGNEVVIVGAGDTACEEALYLSNLCPTVHMIVRKGEMRASKIMQERVLKTKNIKVYFNSETDEILGEEKVNGVRIKNNITGEKLEIHNISGFFTAIGHKPNSDLFKGMIDMDEVQQAMCKTKCIDRQLHQQVLVVLLR